MTPVITSAGGHFLVRGGAASKLTGETPKSRIVIIQFANMDKLLAYWNSQQTQDLLKTGQQYATINAFAVEGVAP